MCQNAVSMVIYELIYERQKTAKMCALRNYNKHKCLNTKREYRKLNSAYKKLSKRCYLTYLNRLQRNFKSRPKSFWKYAENQRKESKLPSHIHLDGDIASADPGICNLFAEKFSIIFTIGPISVEQLTRAVSNVSPLGSSQNGILVDDAAILKATVKLKNSTSKGPDGIPATFMPFMPHLLTPIRHIFKASLGGAIFPALWKEAYMFPVYKKGDNKDINNYRGISAQLCAIAKLFEPVVLDPILQAPLFKRSARFHA
ncbi:uncharacterized protein LOC129737876 [Uranotaenia lowii]|uniref:uncharacterized protein LOC129737876 n=1 Tax=Uranotaenia lowii TaxID=190385 RepID=UPI00247A738A|nr:uncharacterized protein LOC129737876 [Uranotaenia lowii]